jgi:Xaa-Pro aminopeptidase
LTQEEKEWLNQYHHLVYERLSPLLEEPVREWLEEKTSTLGE